MKKRRWDLVHKYEDEARKRGLRAMDVKSAFNLMEDLHRFAFLCGMGGITAKRTQDRMMFLSKRRSKFRNLSA